MAFRVLPPRQAGYFGWVGVNPNGRNGIRRDQHTCGAGRGTPRAQPKADPAHPQSVSCQLTVSRCRWGAPPVAPAGSGPLTTARGAGLLAPRGCIPTSVLSARPDPAYPTVRGPRRSVSRGLDRLRRWRAIRVSRRAALQRAITTTRASTARVMGLHGAVLHCTRFLPG